MTGPLGLNTGQLSELWIDNGSIAADQSVNVSKPVVFPEPAQRAMGTSSDSWYLIVNRLDKVRNSEST